MALEYVARIFNGSDDATENLRQYADHFLAARYGEVADILWRAFRNGIVHGSWPQPICLESDRADRIRVAVGVDPEDPHLDSIEGVAESIFVVNAIQLLQDVEKSIDKFEIWLLSAPDDVLERAAPRLLAISSSDTRAKAQFGAIHQKRIAG